jgi:membrane protease YdiL (CAAX protease family)
MRPYRILLLVIVMVFLGGALLAPWLYWLVQWLAPGSSLAHKPFHRYLDRSLLVLGLLAIWPLLRNLRATSWNDLGLCWPSGQWRRLASGLILGAGSLGCLGAIVLAIHARQFNSELPPVRYVSAFAGAIATAVAVATIEETLFRGAIFGALRREGSWQAALLFSSAFFAFVHFLGKSDLVGPVTCFSGLELLPRMLLNFASVKAVIPGFFNLTLAGVILGVAYQRTGNLYLSMGIHAGWAFWLRFYGLVTQPTPGSNDWLWGTAKLFDGWLALPVLLLALALAFAPRLESPIGDRALQ